ncbi:outer membrane protein assembly factor BamD [bacterium]|nr:MAG: outer membrane protein assembly factor BamD [bacterium]
MRKIYLFIFFVFFLAVNAFALDLQKINTYFLNGDYKAAIAEGERAMAVSSGYSKELDELYIFLGLSYLKDGNYLRASDIFEIIVNEFKGSRYKEEAMLGLVDAYYLKGDFVRAESYCNDLLSKYPNSKFKAAVYYRLSRIALGAGNEPKSNEYMAKLKSEYPLSPELKLKGEMTLPEAVVYTVQVGSFSSIQNAKNLVGELKAKGYQGYYEGATLNNRSTYRVRVGKLKTLSEAENLKVKLSRQGYPTRIYP